MSKANDGPTGSTFDSFLEEEGLLQGANVVAIKRILAWQLEQAMKSKRISKREMAQLLQTSRSQIDRILNPEYVGVSLESVAIMAHALGRRIEVQLVEESSTRKSIHPPQGRTRNSVRARGTRRRVIAA